MKNSRKALFVLIFSIFSLGAFAAPAGSGRPGGGERREGSGDRGGNSGKNGPVFSNNARSRTKSSSSKKSGGEGSKKEKSSFAPAGNAENPSSSNSPVVSESDFSPSENTAMTQNQAEDSGIIYYRGSRVLLNDSAFDLQNIKTERSGENTVNLEITFSQSVNPRTFSADSILVDGKAISSKTKFSFNKKGDTIKLTVPVQSGTFNLMIKDVESFDGTVIDPVTIEVKN